jgi:hypothetical protein
MPEIIGLSRLGSRGRRDLDRKLKGAATSIERQPFDGPVDKFYPPIEGRLQNEDKIVEKRLARKLGKRRAFVRRGHVGRLRARILGMRLLGHRVRRTADRHAACVAEHDLIDKEWSAWKTQMGLSAFVSVVPRPLVLLLAAVGAAAETLFSSGAAEVLVGTTGVVPGWAELPLSLALACLFGLGTLLLTKWGIEEAMLIQLFKGRRARDRLADAPWAGRAPLGRVIRALVAAGAQLAHPWRKRQRVLELPRRRPVRRRVPDARHRHRVVDGGDHPDRDGSGPHPRQAAVERRALVPPESRLLGLAQSGRRATLEDRRGSRCGCRAEGRSQECRSARGLIADPPRSRPGAPAAVRERVAGARRIDQPQGPRSLGQRCGAHPRSGGAIRAAGRRFQWGRRGCLTSVHGDGWGSGAGRER